MKKINILILIMLFFGATLKAMHQDPCEEYQENQEDTEEVTLEELIKRHEEELLYKSIRDDVLRYAEELFESKKKKIDEVD